MDRMLCDNSNAIYSNDYVDYITDYVLPDALIAGSGLDYCNIDINERYRINYVNRGQIEDVNISDYYYYSIPKLYGLQQFNILNLYATNIYQVQQPPLSLTGRDVLVGIVDTGIRFTEPVFRDEYGRSRILAIWDQSIEGESNMPEGIPYGREFLKEELDAALLSENPRSAVESWDYEGHGTSMAAIAAGSDLGPGTFIGAAPEADIVVVKLKQAKQYLRDYYLIREGAAAFQENDIMLGCEYLLRYARLFEKPLVILLGIGTNSGDHAGNSPLGQYLYSLCQKRNIAVVVAAGNEGNKSHHYMGNLRQYMQEELNGTQNYENVEIRVGEGERGFVCELWGSSPDVFEVGITSPGGERIPRINFNYQESLSYGFVYEKTRITIDIVLVEEFSSQQLIFIRMQDPTPGVWTVTVYHQGTLYSGIFHMWLPIESFLTAETYFLKPDPYITITEPGMANGILTVGAYNAADNSFAFFSGRGNTRLGVPKPSLTAPGIDIYTPLGMQNGTSLAAAYGAGAVADFLQWAVVEGNARLVSGVGIMGYMIQGAARNNALSYPNREWGYGALDLVGVFDKLRR